LPTADLVSTVTGATFTLTRALLEQAAGGPLSQGLHSVAVSAEDVYANRSAPVEAHFTLDTTAPARPGLPDLLPGSDSGVRNDDNLTNLTAVSPRITSDADVQVGVRLDGGTVRTFTSTGEVIAALADLADGAHTADAFATDAAGNLSAWSPVLTFTVDLT